MDLWRLGVADIVAAVGARELSVTKLTRTFLKRIDDLDPSLKAWVTVTADEAMQRSAALDAEIAAGKSPGILAGVPIGLKDIIYTAGVRTTASSRALADFVPAYDATCVTALKTSGAVVLGKLHTAEFAFADQAPSVNPWDADRAPGGSSTGSGVAVAAGMIPAALGSQTGGSTLRPAAYNGIVGLKPTSGRISNHGLIPVAWTYDHVGILARSVADAGLLLSALTGYDPLDPLSVPGYADDLGRSLSTSPPAIGVLRFPFADRCDSETRQALVRTIEALERSGAEIREVELPGVFEVVEETAPIITATEVAAYHREQFARLGDRYGPKISATISQGLETSGPDYAQARRRRDLIVRQVESRLAGAADVFVLPAVPTVAPLDRSTTGEQYFLRTWTFTGLPSIVVPIGLSADGLPFSMQMVGHRWADASLLHAAAWVESVVGFDSHPPCWGGTSS